MIRTIPKNKYKLVDIGKNIAATGFKSECYEYPESLNKPVLNNDQISLSIRSGYDTSDFKFTISGRKNLEKLKEAIDFALEIKEDD